MNLWRIFPESLLNIEGILSLPMFAIPFYLYVLYAVVKHSEFRITLSMFLVASIGASSLMFLTLGPQIGKVLPPLLLLLVMLMPVVALCFQMVRKHSIGIWVWSITSIAGSLHSLSWAIWLFALARS